MTRHVRAFAAQPQWHATDFLSAARFQRWMSRQLEGVRPHLHATYPNLVVLTELNGLPLVLRGGLLAERTGRFAWAAAVMAFLYLPAVAYIMAREKVSAIRALQLARSGANTALYLRTCQQLSRQYSVYLVCGSAPTPHYRLKGKHLKRSSELYNQTHIFSPQGELIGTADKVYLTPDEERSGVDLSPGALSQLRVFPTPAGNLGVAISLDAFRQDVIAHLQAQGCTVLLQPDANGSAWSAKESLPPDPEHLRNQPEAWLESSWTVTSTGRVRYAINPMVVGNLLDMTFDGQSAITGPLSKASALQSYAMTTPRPGFLALMPWLDKGGESLEDLRHLGAQRSAHSGHANENVYRTGTLHADLTLPPPTKAEAAPPATAHEEALRAWLKGKATLSRATDLLTPLWLPLGLMACAAWYYRLRRQI